jgi:hypothetical protein
MVQLTLEPKLAPTSQRLRRSIAAAATMHEHPQSNI